MFKFKLGRKQPEDNEARRRLQKELFGLNKVRLQLSSFFYSLIHFILDLWSRFSFTSISTCLWFSIKINRYWNTYRWNSNVSFSFYFIKKFFDKNLYFSYGQPGFQLSYSLDPNPSSSIRKLIFLDGVARLLVLTNDGYLHLLEINNTNPIRIDRICTSNEDDGNILKNIQSICLLRNNIYLLIGLNNGNIYSFNIENFSLNINPIIPTGIIEKT